MTSSFEITLDGHSLTSQTLWKAAQSARDPNAQLRVRISESAWKAISESSAFVEDIVRKGEPVYGINTGFGKFAEVRISPDKLLDLQRNILVSHACGVGELLPREIVLAMWLIRLNVICRGQSGLRPETVRRAIELIEAGILADVPAQGSVGASGDLAPSSHASLPLIGEGFCSYPENGHFVRASSREALQKKKLEAIVLGPKEGLGLINGTQLTTALAVRGLLIGKKLLRTANLNLALSIEALQATHTLLDKRILESRNQPGAAECGKDAQSWLAGKSEIAENHAQCGQVQDPYSLRCAPQVHGAILDDLEHAQNILDRELNSSTDNPLLFAKDGVSLSGGNFHAIYTARVNDLLASALTTLSNISERRVALLMSRESNKLFPFLIEDGGVNSGFMMAQVTAAALVSESKSLSFPASVDSIPTSDDREDHVSMGPIAGKKLQMILENTQNVLAIELLCAAQAIDFLRPLKSAENLERVHTALRKEVPFLKEDRILYKDIEKAAALVASGDLLQLKR